MDYPSRSGTMTLGRTAQTRRPMHAALGQYLHHCEGRPGLKFVERGPPLNTSWWYSFDNPFGIDSNARPKAAAEFPVDGTPARFARRTRCSGTQQAQARRHQQTDPATPGTRFLNAHRPAARSTPARRKKMRRQFRAEGPILHSGRRSNCGHCRRFLRRCEF